MVARPGFVLGLAVVSLLGNLALGGAYYFKNEEAKESAEEVAERRAERDHLMDLIPALHPSVTQDALAAFLSSRHPGEQVNVGRSEVQWRLFHFWYDKSGRLESVQWGS